jgi:Na+-driven multidrug efflux pump
MRILVILFLVVILGSLGTALYYLLRDQGRSGRTVKALTVRVALSIVLFALLMVGYATGIIPRGGL